MDDLVHLGSEQVQCRHDPAVGSEVVLLHDLSIVDGVADIDVAVERYIKHGRVKVDDIWRSLLRVKMRVYALHKGRLPRSYVLFSMRCASISICIYHVPAMPTQTMVTGLVSAVGGLEDAIVRRALDFERQDKRSSAQTTLRLSLSQE